MQWSQIKSLFILCFLVLDVYLLYQFVTKQQESDHDILGSEMESTIQDTLDAENIKITSDLPEGDIKGNYISVQQKDFTEEEIGKVKAVKGQKTAVIDKKLIISNLKEPIPVAEDASNEEVTALVRAKLPLISPKSYVLSDWNKDQDVLIFFQKKNDRPIYFGQNGMLLIFLNGNNEISSYTQTMLGEEESQQSEESLIKPIKAINILYQKNGLYTNEKVTKVDIGYHTRIPVENGTQLFAPTWKITIDNKRTYFVNALEGLINISDDMEFLKEALTSIHEKVNAMQSKPDLKKYFLNILKYRFDGINTVNRSDTE